jgi:hypothetical protein
MACYFGRTGKRPRQRQSDCGCLKAAGKTADDLAPGVQIADKDKFFSFTRGRILTLDY